MARGTKPHRPSDNGLPQGKRGRPAKHKGQPALPPPTRENGARYDHGSGIAEKREAKALIRDVLDGLLPDLDGYIKAAAQEDPGKAAGLILQLAEFSVPKIARLEVGIEALTDEQLLRELERREQMESRRAPSILGATDVEDAESLSGEAPASETTVEVNVKSCD